MHATRNSSRSRSSSSHSGAAQAWIVWTILLFIGTLAAAWFFQRGYILYYGDAEAHLNVARRIIDSRTPGYEQIGTVWLPLPHALMLPFVGNDYLWRTGLAGTIPSVFCFSLAGTALFLTIRRIFESTPAAICSAALLALNPNVLYLSSIPMTEALLLAGLFWLVYFVVRFQERPCPWMAMSAGFCAAAICLTRYEGWMLLPFVAIYLLVTGGLKSALIFAVIAGAAPLYWLAHNYWYYSNALEFYNGPYSPMAIQRGLPYPGKGNISTAVRYYFEAVRLCAGTVLLGMGAAGILVALWRRAWLVAALLALIPAFYVLNLYGGASPVRSPTLWPNDYYNTRYGIGTLPLLIAGASALVTLMPQRFARTAALLIVIAAAIPWLAHPSPNNWIVWKESQVNSVARRAWTREAADYLRASYHKGDGILISAGDLFGVIREAGLQLRDTLHIGNGPHVHAVLARPDLFLWEEFTMGISADDISSAMMKDMKTASEYKLVKTLHKRNGPVIEIYRREHDYSIH